jgi:hypothetical protein
MPTGSLVRWPPPKKPAEGGLEASVSDNNDDAAITTTGDQVIQLCEELSVVICLLCPAVIKPDTDQVKHHYRNRHRTIGAQLQEVIAFAASFSPSGSRPRVLRDPTDEDLELPADGSPPTVETKNKATYDICKH